jgi:hypothetical protein
MKLVFAASAPTDGVEAKIKASTDLETYLTALKSASKPNLPIQKVFSLMTWATLDSIGERELTSTCTSKANMDATTKGLAPSRDAIKDLISSAKYAVGDLKANLKNLHKKSTVAEKETTPAPSATVVSAWELFGEKATPFTIHSHPIDVPKFVAAQPCIITQAKDLIELCNTTLSSQLNGFGTTFSTHKIRENEGRAQKRIVLSPEGLADLNKKMMDGVVPSVLMMPISADELAKRTLFSPYMFAIVPGQDFVSTEISQLACVRVGAMGTRECVCVSLSSLRAAIVKLESLAVGTITMKKCSQFLKFMTAAKLESIPEVVFWKATMGKGDIMYMPAGMLVMERIHNNADFIGVRCSILVNDADALLELIAIGGVPDLAGTDDMIFGLKELKQLKT